MSPLRCYVGGEEVSRAEHYDIQKVWNAMIDAEVEGFEDVFVHTTGPEEEFDEDGNVVVCPKHFVEEWSRLQTQEAFQPKTS